NQVHGSRIAKVDKFDKANEIQNCDGAYTTDAQTPIAVFTADCLSLFFYEPNKNVAGIVHAGWRGSFERIAAKMVRTLAKDCEANPKEMVVAFGPSIRECCYQVGEELAEYFPNSVDKRKGAFYLDLFRENKSQLLSEGVKEKNIFDSGICTSCENKNFFSYRLEKEKAGRMMSVVMLS
ncbi:MAG: peptidoglycan editing factor PgeF, partial [Candidatus Omnitrophica bacterium]|nr:peptidoglycan editing factor PgeF [Candidatus Omnitrophota bacterium]